MGPNDVIAAANRVRDLVIATDTAHVRAIALELVSAARAAAMTDKTPDYDYVRADRNRDRRGELPGPGEAWETPREILARALRALERAPSPVKPAGPHVRSLTNESLAAELTERSRTVDGALCSGPGMMFADRAVYAEAARRLQLVEQSRRGLLIALRTLNDADGIDSTGGKP